MSNDVEEKLKTEFREHITAIREKIIHQKIDELKKETILSLLDEESKNVFGKKLKLIYDELTGFMTTFKMNHFVYDLENIKDELKKAEICISKLRTNFPNKKYSTGNLNFKKLSDREYNTFKIFLNISGAYDTDVRQNRLAKHWEEIKRGNFSNTDLHRMANTSFHSEDFINDALKRSKNKLIF